MLSKITIITLNNRIFAINIHEEVSDGIAEEYQERIQNCQNREVPLIFNAKKIEIVNLDEISHLDGD